MKAFRNFVFSSLIVLSALVFINLNFGLDITGNVGALFEGTEYVEELKAVTSLEPIVEMVPVEYKETVTEVIEQITSDPKTQKVINNQVNTVINDIAKGTMTVDEAYMQAELAGLIDTYAPAIEKATNKTITKEVIKTRMQEVVTGYDVKTVYEKVINQVQKQLTPSQIKMINLANDVQNAGTTWKTVSLVVMGISVLALIGFNLKFDWIKKLLPIAIILFVFTFISKVLVRIVINTFASKAGLDASTLNISYSFYSNVMIALVVIAVLSIVGAFLVHKYDERMYL
ncbi:hypothetical protein G7059_07515 [Erysipelothrix sp. HDW6A]|uniref:hypothetical protein n=1 Tax=Erysipelothrix sp. HDW6A TaxID=2714928 RepID=UPI00140AC2F8|nr:hypothetical protein [Erysipelothrix sp. HDW6A]QIK57695.1 hypothetical protein G7059_07515 [Erysipelothrix sp. HDW6A]